MANQTKRSDAMKPQATKFFAVVKNHYGEIAVIGLNDNKQNMLAKLATDLEEDNLPNMSSTSPEEMEDLDITVYEVLSTEHYGATSAGVTLTKK